MRDDFCVDLLKDARFAFGDNDVPFIECRLLQGLRPFDSKHHFYCPDRVPKFLEITGTSMVFGSYTRHSSQGCALGARTIPGGGGYEVPCPWALSLVCASRLDLRIADGA